MNASIDRSGCISCGLCADLCPAVFQMGDDGLAEVHTQPNAESIDTAREAADSCPVSVIIVEE